MQISNTTALPALVNVTDQPAMSRRWVTLCAKATFTWEGQPRLVSDHPLPLLANDVPTPLGLLPRDDLPRIDPAFEVILLGQALAPGGIPVLRMTVGLRVGSVLRQLHLHGDRQWEKGPQDKDRRIGPPAPFSAMPLTWDRAFGGRVDVEIDREAFVEVCDPRNPDGRGFDARAHAEALGKGLKAPEPYPRWNDQRMLPNLEHPNAPIQRYEDAPDPACWAPLPPTSSLHAQRALTATGITPGMFHRAVPEWVIALPEAGAQVASEGLGMESFALPRLSVLVDVLHGEQAQTLALRPHMLVLLPEQRAFTLLYRTGFPVESPNGTARSLRLRTADGWGDT